MAGRGGDMGCERDGRVTPVVNGGGHPVSGIGGGGYCVSSRRPVVAAGTTEANLGGSRWRQSWRAMQERTTA
jgi:hypothetical protein